MRRWDRLKRTRVCMGRLLVLVLVVLHTPFQHAETRRVPTPGLKRSLFKGKPSFVVFDKFTLE